MKASFFLSIFFCFIPLFVFAQIPQSPNAFDAEGNKHGRWTYTYSPSWNLTEDPDSLAYYRLITYEHGVPQGVVRDYYLSGAIQWEGNLLADEPEEVMDGGCAWYYEDGQKKEEAAYRHGIVNGSFRSWFPNGQLAVEGQYQNGVKEGNWAYWDEQGNLLMKKNFTPGEGMSGQELNQKMANAYRRGDYETALSWGEKALRRAETRFGKQHENYTTSLNNLFLIYYNMGLYEKAESLFIKGTNAFLTQLSRYYPGLNEAEKLRFLKSKIEFQFQCYYAFALRHSDDFPGLLPVMMNLNLASKGLSLSTATNTREAILQSNDTGLLKLYKQWLIQRRQIAQTIALSINERNKRGINLGVLEARADSLEKILRLNSQSFADQFETTRYQWQDVQNSLEENEVSISFLDFPYYNGKEWTDSTYYVALAVRPESEHPQLVKLCLARDLKKFLNYEKADERDTYIADSEAAYQLYQLIWAPLLPYIKERTAVHYSPSGLLNRIAFQILTDSEGKRLNEEYSLNQYTTIRDFVRLRKQKNEANALTVASFGGSNFDQALDGKTDKEKPEITNGQSHTFNLPRGLNERTKSWPYLTGTLKEASNIVDLFGSSGWEPQLFQGALATESNLKQLSGNSPCILHIATHGFFLKPQEQKVLPGSSQDPLLFKYEFYKPRPQGFGEIVPFIQHPLLRSGLIFTGANHAWQGKKVPEGMDDGILTAYEIVNLDLRNTELVVLSACETGLGNIESTEGVFGLQRAFKQAGVNKVIMSLWKIPDAETVEFMEAFYGNYLGGKTVREAFVGAQREMAGKYAPYFWAGFVLVE